MSGKWKKTYFEICFNKNLIIIEKFEDFDMEN